MPPTTTPIVRTGRCSCGRRIRRLACTSPASASQVQCAGATDSAGCSTSTTDELHERISAPHGAATSKNIEVVVLEASGALTVGQHDHIHELLERLQRIEAAVTHGQGSGSAR